MFFKDHKKKSQPTTCQTHVVTPEDSVRIQDVVGSDLIPGGGDADVNADNAGADDDADTDNITSHEGRVR